MPSSLAFEEEGEYEIEQVRGIRINMASETEYLCHWSGYESEDDSWEYYESLTNADRHIEDYKTRSAGRQDGCCTMQGGAAEGVSDVSSLLLSFSCSLSLSLPVAPH